MKDIYISSKTAQNLLVALKELHHQIAINDFVDSNGRTALTLVAFENAGALLAFASAQAEENQNDHN